MMMLVRARSKPYVVKCLIGRCHRTLALPISAAHTPSLNPSFRWRSDVRGISDRFAPLERLAAYLDLQCSTPFGISDRFAGVRAAGADRVQTVLNAFRHQ
jgi:hypothetical protein